MRTWMLGVMLAMAARAEHCPQLRTVSIRIFDDVGLDRKTVSVARHEAGWILKSLCLAVDWSEAAGSQLEIRIRHRPEVAEITADALGLAMPTFGKGNHGAVFFDRIQERAGNLTASLPVLLACVLAHEAGHLLLHTNDHSAEGVMIRNFGRVEIQMAGRRRLTFTAADRNRFGLVQLAGATRR
ncbi:MAG: hypothetical protein ABI806_06495 [Candidatus Solibacter sp.]